MSQPDTPLRVHLTRKQPEAHGICSLVLEPVAGTLPAFSAGAHIDVHLPNGLVRQYSLCNAPSEANRYVIAVLLDAASRGGSRAVHDQVPPGAELQISAPRNHFPLADDAPHHLLFAGGIGITPMLAMAETLTPQGASFELHYAARSRERMAFTERIGQSAYAGRAHFHFDDGPPAQRLDIAAQLQRAPQGSHLYVCGPQGFMDAVLKTAREQGWDESRLHYEYFGAAPTQQADDGSFDIELASSGRVIPVTARQTPLQALLDAGIDIPMSCEQGVCGTCLTRVISGTPDHRDHYLTPDEHAANDQFLPCCSRSRSPRLVLDL